jgi:hypothetical protein
MARAYPPTGSQPPSVELIVRQGPRPGQRFSLTKSTIIIGREAGNDVVINHPEVSRRHASLTWDGTQHIVQDLGSVNGTFVNGVRLTAPQVLQQGDVIGLGPTVLLGFHALPAYVPSRPTAPPPHAPRPPARRRRRFLIPLTALLGLCFVLAVAAAAGYFFLRPRGEARPLVLINSPRHGEQIEVGQEVTVHSIARDEGKVTRVELWVDGQLQESQTSSLPGGTSPFPLLARWQPSSPGTHTLIARAFNARGGRGQASVNVEAIEEADRDGDGVADEADACPDEPGTETADGCPDRDSDGIPDAEDACPDEAGLPEGEGCPVPSEGDGDGDGVFDEADACPDVPGSPLADGCPDADDDGIPDAEDACPDEPGLPEHDGCPAPGDLDGDGVPDAEDECPEELGLSEHAGCPDRDGDGVRDVDDDCPGEPGLPEHAGCPDRDGDGVPDPDDLRPDEPGQPDAGGAPDTGAGDRDSDGIPDDADLCPDHAGLPEHAGCPPPPGSEEEEPGAIPLWPPPGGGPFGDLGGDVRVLPVEFEALEFEVFDDYDEVYCYAGLAGEGMERYGPFELLGERRWDIAAHLGGENSRTVAMHDDEPLEVHVECGGVMGQGVIGIYWGLGSFIQHHPLSDWDGHVLTGDSSGGDQGHSFQAQYRICRDSCEEAAFAPPLLLLTEIGPPFGGDPYMRVLTWRWDGDESMISEFRLYVNGSFYRAFRPDQRSWELPSDLEPACGEGLEFQMTASEGPTPVPNRESPRSNTLVIEGPPCPRTVRVTFLHIQTYDLPADPPDIYHDSCWDTDVGPIDMAWSATGSDTSRLWSAYGQGLCRRGHNCRRIGGYCLHPNTRHSITDIIERCRYIRDELSHDRYPYGPKCPNNNLVDVTLGPNDDLVVNALIQDMDTQGSLEYLMQGRLTVGSEELIPGSEYERTISDRDDRGFADVTVRIEVLPVGP